MICLQQCIKIICNLPSFYWGFWDKVSIRYNNASRILFKYSKKVQLYLDRHQSQPDVEHCLKSSFLSTLDALLVIRLEIISPGAGPTMTQPTPSPFSPSAQPAFSKHTLKTALPLRYLAKEAAIPFTSFLTQSTTPPLKLAFENAPASEMNRKHPTYLFLKMLWLLL